MADFDGERKWIYCSQENDDRMGFWETSLIDEGLFIPDWQKLGIWPIKLRFTQAKTRERQAYLWASVGNSA